MHSSFNPLVLAMITVTAAGLASAQTSENQKNAVAVLPTVFVNANPENSFIYQSNVDVASAGFDADLKVLPTSIQSINQQLIDDQGVIRIAEAVRNVSAVTRAPAYMGLTDQYRVRGFSASTGLWNGFRRDHYYSVTDTSHIQQVDVIKGVASVQFGDMEPGGVVHYVTKRPQANDETTLRLSVGSLGLVRPEFDTQFSSEQGAVKARFTGAYEKNNEFKDHVTGDFSTLGTAIDWQVNEDTEVAGHAYWYDADKVPDRGFFNSLGPLTLDLPRERYYGEPDDRYTFEQTDVGVQFKQRINNIFSFQLGVNQTAVDDVRDNFQQRDLQPDGRTLRRQYTYVPGSNETTQWTASTTAKFETGAVSHQVVIGVDHISVNNFYNFRRDRSQDYSIDLYQPVYGYYPRILGAEDKNYTDSTSQGIYLQNLMQFGEKWHVLAGVRYTKFEQTDTDNSGTKTDFKQNKASPRVGVTYAWSPQHTSFVSYSEGFKPQPYTRLASKAIATPEQSQQYELGHKFQLAANTSVNATIFQITKQNIASTDPNDADFSILTGEQQVKGIELDVKQGLDHGVDLIASYALLSGKVSEDTDSSLRGDRLVNTPKHQASLWASKTIQSLPLTFGLGAFYVGSREAELPNSFTVPAYTRLDASAKYQVNSATLVQLNIHNLTDKTYFDSQDNLLYAGEPLNAKLMFQYQF